MTTYLHLYNIKQNFSQNEKCSSEKSVEKIKTRFMFNNIYIEIVPFMR